MADIGVVFEKVRLVMLDDVCECKDTLVEGLEAEKNLVCKKRPEKCPKCS